MEIEDIDIDIILSKNYKGFYLLYDGKNQYILFKPDNNNYYTMSIKLDNNPDELESNVIGELSETLDESKLDNGVRVILGGIESTVNDKKTAIDILQELFVDLSEAYYQQIECNESDRRIKRLEDVTHPKIVNKINELSNTIIQNKRDDELGGLFTAFKTRKGVKKAQRDLGNYLNTECGIVLRENTHDLYKLDVANKGYDSTTVDKIIALLTGIFGETNLFSTNDVETAVDFISDRLTPEYNIVKFSNGLYSMKQHKLIEPEKPVFTLIESPYAYNPNAKSKYIEDYLYSSLEKATDEKTAEYVIGVLEYIGYLFTSGNSRNILGWITGIGGGGKSTFANIIQAIFGNKCADLDFAEIENNTHSTSILVGNHLNIVREAETKIVINNKPYKKMVGDEPIPINPKNKHPFMLPKEEVPKSIMVANNIPPFKNPVASIIQRFLIIEFNKLFRNTDDMIENLDDKIIESDGDMEWLIYHSLEAYKTMIESGNGFKLKLSDEKTKEIMYKHSKPLNYLITKLIDKHDKEAFETDVKIYDDSNGETIFIKPYILTAELNELIVYQAKKEGIEIPLSEKTGKVDGRLLTKAIKDEFDLHEYYLETKNGGNKKYTSITKRDSKTGEVIRYYPELIKSGLYDETLTSTEFQEYLEKLKMEKGDN